GECAASAVSLLRPRSHFSGPGAEVASCTQSGPDLPSPCRRRSVVKRFSHPPRILQVFERSAANLAFPLRYAARNSARAAGIAGGPLLADPAMKSRLRRHGLEGVV